MTAPAVCEHGRTAAACEACAHAAALADPKRAPSTRDELYPFPEGGPLQSGFVGKAGPDDASESTFGPLLESAPRKRGRKT